MQSFALFGLRNFPSAARDFSLIVAEFYKKKKKKKKEKETQRAKWQLQEMEKKK